MIMYSVSSGKKETAVKNDRLVKKPPKPSRGWRTLLSGWSGMILTCCHCAMDIVCEAFQAGLLAEVFLVELGIAMAKRTAEHITC